MSDPLLPNIYILYNAKASVIGKLDYVCRKLTASADTPACSACELTHGGLHLNETQAWAKAKGQIVANVYQLHIDELGPEVRQFVKETSLRFPAVLGQKQAGPFKILLNAEDLKGVSKDHQEFLKQLVSSSQREGVPISLKG